MANRLWLGCAACFFLVCCVPLRGQVEALPIAGGDVVPPLIHSFLPGEGPGFDGVNADPNNITNFQGVVAMGYTAGTATDSAGNNYNIGADIRVFRGNYVGATGTAGGVGASKSGRGFGTFVLI